MNADFRVAIKINLFVLPLRDVRAKLTLDWFPD
jgi:hypothetical protein